MSSVKASILLRREWVFAGIIALQLLILIRRQPVSCDDFFPLFAEENVRLGAFVHAQISAVVRCSLAFVEAQSQNTGRSPAAPKNIGSLTAAASQGSSSKQCPFVADRSGFSRRHG